MRTPSVLARSSNKIPSVLVGCAMVAVVSMVGCAPDASDVPVAAAPGTGGSVDLAVVSVTNLPTVTTTGVTVNVIAIDNTFRAKNTAVTVGDTVVFTNKGKNDHDVLPQTGNEWGVHIAGFHPGDTYSYVFTKPGVYSYYCSIHGTNQKGMVGTVTVRG